MESTILRFEKIYYFNQDSCSALSTIFKPDWYKYQDNVFTAVFTEFKSDREVVEIHEEKSNGKHILSRCKDISAGIDVIFERN